MKEETEAETSEDTTLATTEEVTKTVVVMSGEEAWKYVKANEDGSLQIKSTTPYEAWEVLVLSTLESGKRTQYIAGQLLLFGKKAYGEKYSQVIDGMKYSPKALQNAEWVVEAVGPRWHHTLSFAHHEKVARLTEEAQKEMLDIAVADVLTVSKLAKKIKTDYPPKKKTGQSKKEAKAFQLDATDHGEVMNAAQQVVSAFEVRLGDYLKWPERQREDFENLAKAFRQMLRRATGKN